LRLSTSLGGAGEAVLDATYETAVSIKKKNDSFQKRNLSLASARFITPEPIPAVLDVAVGAGGGLGADGGKPPEGGGGGGFGAAGMADGVDSSGY